MQESWDSAAWKQRIYEAAREEFEVAVHGGQRRAAKDDGESLPCERDPETYDRSLDLLPGFVDACNPPVAGRAASSEAIDPRTPPVAGRGTAIVGTVSSERLDAAGSFAHGSDS